MLQRHTRLFSFIVVWKNGMLRWRMGTTGLPALFRRRCV